MAKQSAKEIIMRMNKDMAKDKNLNKTDKAMLKFSILSKTLYNKYPYQNITNRQYNFLMKNLTTKEKRLIYNYNIKGGRK